MAHPLIKNLDATQESIPKTPVEELTEIETELISRRSDLRRSKRANTQILGFIGLLVMFIYMHYTQKLILASWLIIVLWIIAGLVALIIVISHFSDDFSDFGNGYLKLEVEKLEVRKDIYLKFLNVQSNTPNYFDSLVRINIENLEAYYSLVKKHTSQSFKMALLVSIVGFFLIAIGLVIGFKSEEKLIGYISAGSGVLTEFISGVLFYLYNKTVRQLKEYHDSLIGVQNILLSFKLIEGISEEKIKAEMMLKMVEFLVQKK